MYKIGKRKSIFQMSYIETFFFLIVINKYTFTRLVSSKVLTLFSVHVVSDYIRFYRRT